MATVKTTCPYCGVGCGILTTPRPDGTVEIKGDPEHPANFGRLCSKGSALGETLSLDDRLLHPEIFGERATWESALDLIAGRINDALAKHGPESVALYVSGQILTEDYYVANKLMKGFIGTANIDTNSRLCMASSVAGHKRAFGSDTVPGTYEDLEAADLVVLVGSNLAWCHPVLFQRLAAAKENRGTKIVVVDPRRTPTAEIADLHLAIKPGTDVSLFNGLLTNIVAAEAVNKSYVAQHTSGAPAAMAAARTLSFSEIARVTGLSQLDLHTFYDLFTATERVVTVYSQGVNQSTAGTDKVNAIINCHLATGRIGRPGMGPFSVTGQPNAMGGREVGGLANMLAAHMELSDPAHRKIVQDFWRSPRIADRPGLKAVDMFQAIGDGRIKAVWIMATNPVDSLPEADSARAALAKCPFVVVSDVTRHTDTAAMAHVLLPSLGWGEKDGTVTNSERRISRQRSFLPAPGEARADWWQLAEVGRRMGHANAFSWRAPDEIFAEHAALSGYCNGGTRDFDIGAYATCDSATYAELAPFQWPQAAGDAPRETRYFGEGDFYTADRRARFVAVSYRAPATSVSAEFPLILNTGRIRDQWHTMTRTAKTARLMSHMSEPFVELHPDDASRFGLEPASLARVDSLHGTAILRVLVSERQQRGSAFAPIHWTDQLSGSARIDALVGANLDPVSGQPESKFTPVRVTPYSAAWYAFAVGNQRPARWPTGYWALARAKDGWRGEFADATAPDDWAAIFDQIFPELRANGDTDVLAYRDHAAGSYRFAAFAGDRLAAALFIAARPVGAARDFLSGELGKKFTDPASRFRVLAGRAAADRPDPGPTVCSCFDVGRNQILAAVLAGNGISVEAVGRATRAGTNCGSCRAEIGGLIHAARCAKAV